MGIIKIDFDKFDKTGLKPILKKFETAGLTVDDIEAPNKAKRESGFLIKTAVLVFASGQKLTVKAKAGGGIFQVKLNSKVLPIKAVDDMDKAVDEVITHVKANEGNYLKQKERSAARIKVPKVKNVNTSVAAQIDAVSASIEQFKGMKENITTEIQTATQQVTDLTTRFTDLDTQLAAEKKRTNELTMQIEALQEGA
ncbi:hypothetical protein [Desulfatirhabdium butyrativorans]|uniref:defense against restriction DarA-related protein n=1 Tax=Desulfatirhabdium butyrativorans TaxID=340467 RepID=UPI0004150C3E|nr:hypothetical protein [Desulfatirhabdium butyrativorans]